MSAQRLPAEGFCQVAMVVKDIERAAKAYADVFGVDVPNVHTTDTADKTKIRYRGRPTAARAKLAFFEVGSILLELIEPVGGPSIWQEFLDTRGQGVHHIAFRVKGMEQVLTFLEDKNIPTVQQGEFTGGRYAYADGTQELGVLLELLEGDDS